MRIPRQLVVLTIAMGAQFAMPASAHHSFSMFDADKTMPLTGTVKNLDWTNPHAWLNVLVKGDDGKVVEWPLEMQGTGQSTKTGWRSDSVKPGDMVTVQIRPMKSGARGGQLVEATLPGGLVLGARGAPNNPYGD